MSDTEAKVDEEKNVDNDIVQEVEAEKEDANVDVKNASNEIEVEKKDDFWITHIGCCLLMSIFSTS